MLKLILFAASAVVYYFGILLPGLALGAANLGTIISSHAMSPLQFTCLCIFGMAMVGTFYEVTTPGLVGIMQKSLNIRL